MKGRAQGHGAAGSLDICGVVDLVSGFPSFLVRRDPITFMPRGRLSWRRLQNSGPGEVQLGGLQMAVGLSGIGIGEDPKWA